MFVVSFCVAVYSVYILFVNYNKYQQSAGKYEDVKKLYEEANVNEVNTSKQENLKEINSDYVGWISIANTNVNYPVVQGIDNFFYLSHNFYKEEDFVGSIFLDERNSLNPVDQHLILYGHNMKDRSMFGSLRNYLDEEFYRSHKFITFDLLDTTYEWEVFSIYKTEDVDWMKTSFEKDSDFEKFVNNLKQQSIVPIEVEVKKEDRILTLSTCTNATETERVIVHAKLK
ncbi:class B sortase [Metabacillus litoralis]|uniref:class B sortase n=1 Tax=Metabacillus litoralis TaxID=152268 RepID=UPI00131513BD|nr:class B sortase [Metabacillus litoralis]